MSALQRPLDAVDTVRRGNLVGSIADILREAILTGRIPAGTKLLQVELAEQLDVSRTPLREAFRVLEQEGLIRLSNRNNTVEVVDLTTEDMRELYEIRAVVDGLAARLCAERGLQDSMLSVLEHAIAEMDAARSPEFDAAGFGVAHRRFHSLLVEHCGNRRLMNLLPIVSVSAQMLIEPIRRLDEAASESMSTDGVLGAASRTHRAILDAIRDRDASAAEQRARQHIDTSHHLFVGSDR